MHGVRCLFGLAMFALVAVPAGAAGTSPLKSECSGFHKDVVAENFKLSDKSRSATQGRSPYVFLTPPTGIFAVGPLSFTKAIEDYTKAYRDDRFVDIRHNSFSKTNLLILFVNRVASLQEGDPDYARHAFDVYWFLRGHLAASNANLPGDAISFLAKQSLAQLASVANTSNAAGYELKVNGVVVARVLGVMGDSKNDAPLTPAPNARTTQRIFAAALGVDLLDSYGDTAAMGTDRSVDVLAPTLTDKWMMRASFAAPDSHERGIAVLEAFCQE